MVNEHKTHSPQPNLINHERAIYRSLDDKGQHTVDTVAQMEYERVKKDNK